MLGWPEILMILIVVVLIFGATRLPQLGDALGRSIRNFKSSVRGENEIDVTPDRAEVEAGAEKAAADKE